MEICYSNVPGWFNYGNKYKAAIAFWTLGLTDVRVCLSVLLFVLYVVMDTGSYKRHIYILPMGHMPDYNK